MVKRSAYIIIIGLLASSVAFSQDKVLKQFTTSNGWSPGSILTSDGTELKGSVKYDDKLGVVNFENDDESKSFNSRNVTAFEFFDETSQKQRVFYSLEYEDSDKSIRASFFFEVLKDFKNFAVLSKVDPIKLEARTRNSSYWDPNTGMRTYTGTTTGPTEIVQVETIYFLDEHGKIEPYIQVVNKVIDRKLFDEEQKKSKYIDKDVVSKYFTKEALDKMMEYAKKNDLSFRVKTDFMKILEFCEELMAK